MVYDSFGVRPDETRVARLTVNAILMSASIQAGWHDCSEGLTAQASGLRRLNVQADPEP